MQKRIKQLQKFLSVLLIATLVVAYSLPAVVLAQDVTPDPTPTPTPVQTEITNDATGGNTTNTEANTGDNTIGEPTPTPSPSATEEQATPTPTPLPSEASAEEGSPSPTPTPEDATVASEPEPATEGSVEATNSALVTNEATSSAESGENAISSSSTDSSSSDATGEGSSNSENAQGQNAEPGNVITTGDAVAVTTVDNEINTTQINSEVIFQTINIFVDEEGDIDLSNPGALIESLVRAYPEQAEINVSLTTITNTASLNNTVTSGANTGNNQIYGGEEGNIRTGDAYSLVSLLNRVNFVMVDSTLHAVTINIFGHLVGNIILPDAEPTAASEPCEDCGSVQVDNQATVHNTVDSQAISGQNEIVDAGQADITTGNAVSVIQLTNLVNVNVINGNIWQLWITPFGVWEGSFVGWGPLGSQPGGQNLTLSHADNGNGDSPPCDSCVGDLAIGNSANVTNSVTSKAKSGGNLIQGAEDASIATGRATSVVSLLNFVNSNFIRTRAFFGFINIFGKWTGNIGGASFFASQQSSDGTSADATDTTSEDSSATETKTQETSAARESGGQLTITQSNNVGEYVLPGDTVTFFMTVKNTGNGRVYDTVLDLRLLKEDSDVGGAQFSLGTIDPGKGVKVTTGLVLSPETPAGTYLARATVSGVVGPNNDGVQTSADSSFVVFGNSAVVLASEGTTPPLSEGAPAVLGTTYPSDQESANILLALLVWLLVIPAYVLARIPKQRVYFVLVFTRHLSLRERLRALQFFLL